MGQKPSAAQAAALQGAVDAACEEAARIIAGADIFLLCTGAGFSADSGLAIYADVAKVPAYRKKGLDYRDICDPCWLESDPDLFWGFWGQCYNDYRQTAPHEGYAMVDRWAERWFRHSPKASQMEALMQARSSNSTADDSPYPVHGHPGAFFAFTSNVDAHHFDWFRACEIRECHGNTELYQCAEPSTRSCRDAVWRAPCDFSFVVDTERMVAPETVSSIDGLKTPQVEERKAAVSQPERTSWFGWLTCLFMGSDKRKQKGQATKEADTSDTPDRMYLDLGDAPVQSESTADDGQSASAAAVGRVRGGGRPHLLRYMPQPPEAQVQLFREGFKQNHPSCPICMGPARPAILMFGDGAWNDVNSQARRWNLWKDAVGKLAEEAKSQEKPLKVAILEVGCGGNVMTVRSTAERQLTHLHRRGAAVRLIRVNPELPLGDDNEFAPGGELQGLVLSVMSRGLESLQKIDAAMQMQDAA